MMVGYMRVSTDGDRQVLDLRRDVLLASGLMSGICSKIAPAAAATIVAVLRTHWPS